MFIKLTSIVTDDKNHPHYWINVSGIICFKRSEDVEATEVVLSEDYTLGFNILEVFETPERIVAMIEDLKYLPPS